MVLAQIAHFVVDEGPGAQRRGSQLGADHSAGEQRWWEGGLEAQP